MLNTLDDTFNEAVQQLLQWGGVFMGEDATYVDLSPFPGARADRDGLSGKRYLAHKTPVMSWECSLRVKTRQAWSEWQRSILGASDISAYTARSLVCSHILTCLHPL